MSVGISLLLRFSSKSKVALLPPKGQELFDYAKKILFLIEEAKRRVVCREPGGKFRIGTMESTLASRLTDPLARLHARHTHVHLELTTGTSRYLYTLLMENQLDAVFIADPPVDERMEYAAVFDEELVLVASRAHKPIYEPADLVGDTLLVFKEGCSYGSRMVNWFRAYEREPERIADLTSYNAIMGGAASGMGVGIVPASVVEQFSRKEALSLHSLPHPLGKVFTVLAWRKGMMSPNIFALQECLAE